MAHPLKSRVVKGKGGAILNPELKKDPVAFIRALLVDAEGNPANPHPTQEIMLRGVKKLTTARCGRQWGKSLGWGWYITWFAVTHPNREVYIIAPSVDQSRIIFNEVARQFRSPSVLSTLLVGKIKEYPFPEIRLANGTKIHGRGANNPQFIRGKRVHLAVLDEAAHFKSGVITNVIEPMFTVTGQTEDAALVMVSTPFGLGEFHDYCVRSEKMASEGKNASHFHFSSLENPKADFEKLYEIRDTYGETSLLWLTEYLAEFADGDLAVFPWAHIKWAIDHHPYEQPIIGPQEKHRYVQGVDLANLRDFTVSTILDVTDSSLIPLVRMDRMQKRGYTAYKAIIRSNFKTYNNAKTIVDATSLGESVAEDLRDIAAEGYKLSNQSKHEVVQELARLLAEHRLTLPNDTTIIDELKYFQYEITPSKALRMQAIRGHDDIVMSLALAAHLASFPSIVGWFKGVGGAKPETSQKKTPIKVTVDPIRALFDEEYELEHSLS